MLNFKNEILIKTNDSITRLVYSDDQKEHKRYCIDRPAKIYFLICRWFLLYFSYNSDKLSQIFLDLENENIVDPIILPISGGFIDNDEKKIYGFYTNNIQNCVTRKNN